MPLARLTLPNHGKTFDKAVRAAPALLEAAKANTDEVYRLLGTTAKGLGQEESSATAQLGLTSSLITALWPLDAGGAGIAQPTRSLVGTVGSDVVSYE
jgi:hypothetical protein